MKPQTRIELFQRDAVVSLPLHLPKVFVPHAVLIALIVVAWTADGIYSLVASLI
jgi:hypothetical protein